MKGNLNIWIKKATQTISVLMLRLQTVIFFFLAKTIKEVKLFC